MLGVVAGAQPAGGLRDGAAFRGRKRKWFEGKRIEIDKYTLLLLVEKHRSIHRGTNGGPWNAAWNKFIQENDDAVPEEIFRYAGQLIYEFELLGPVMSYRRQQPQQISPGTGVP